MGGKLIALYHQRELWSARRTQSDQVAAAQFNSPPAARFDLAHREALVAAIRGKRREPRIRQPQLHRAQPCGVQVLAVATDPSDDPRLFVVVFDFHPLHVTRYM